MAKYETAFMTDSTQKEINELLNGEHGAAITMFGLECARAGIKGYENGLTKSIVGGALVTAAIGACIGIVRMVRKKRKETEAFNKTEDDFINES